MSISITPPPALVKLGEKLDKVTQNIQNATDIWQTVPTCSRAKSPPPPSAPVNTAVPLGPTRMDISRSRRIQSQGCFILVKPTSNALKKTFDGLNARTLAQKAKFAWGGAWNAIKDTDTASKLKITEKPRMVFKLALRLARGGIRYEMGNRAQAALLNDSRIASEFEKGFGGASCKGQGATILLQCMPVHFDPGDPAAIGCFEFENKLNMGDVLSMTWCRPPHKRKPEQTMAVLKLKMRSHDLADRLITKGGQLDYTCVLFRKATQEPTRCLRCQNYSHKAANCKTSPNNGEEMSKCAKFNTRQPENSSALFGPPCPYDPRHRPINHPLPLIVPEMLIGEGRALLFTAQSWDIRNLNSRPNWTSREQQQKELGNRKPWEEVDGCILTTCYGYV